MEPPDLILRLIQLHGLLLATFVYCVVVVRPLQPGFPRLLASLPAFVIFSLSPFFVKDSAVLSSGIGLTILWVANFKLLAYSGGRGALSHPELRRPLQWGALLVLPFFPAKNGRAPVAVSTNLLVLGLLAKLAVWLGITAVLVAVELSQTARHLCYAVHFWMFVSLCLDTTLPLGRRLLADIPLQPAMDEPYAAASVREFWGRRYNQIVSATLLETIYKPIVEGRWVAVHASRTPAADAGSEARDVMSSVIPLAAPGNGNGVAQARVQLQPASASGSIADVSGNNCGKARPSTPMALAGLFASFLVSGIMHEICLGFICGCWLEGSFRMLGFFLLQPLVILVQESLKAVATKLVSEQVRCSWAAMLMQRGMTLALLLGSAEWFWGPVESCGADKRGLQELESTMRWLLEQARSPGLLPGR